MRKLLEELVVMECREALCKATEHSSRLVVDFSNVGHMSSSAVGMLIGVHRRIHGRGGRMALCGLAPAIKEVFIITHLSDIFQLCDNVDDAIAAVGGDSQVDEDTICLGGLALAACPVSGCGRWARLGQPAEGMPSFHGSPFFLCANCGTSFVVAANADSHPGDLKASVRAMLFPTYDREFIYMHPLRGVDLIAGSVAVLQVRGVLDLFASEALQRAWLTVPQPRRVLVDLSTATEITAAGADALAALCGSDESGGRTLAWGASAGEHSTQEGFYSSEKEALDALGDVSSTADKPLVVALARDGHDRNLEGQTPK